MATAAKGLRIMVLIQLAHCVDKSDSRTENSISSEKSRFCTRSSVYNYFWMLPDIKHWAVNLLITLFVYVPETLGRSYIILRIFWPSHMVFQPNSYRKVHYMDVSSGWMLSVTVIRAIPVKNTLLIRMPP